MSHTHQATRVMLVEDNLLLRGMLQQIVDDLNGLEVVASCGTLGDARATLRDPATRLDCLVLDIGLPDGSGWELLNEPAILTNGIKVFFATGRKDEHSLLLYSRRRVAGYIDKISATLTDWRTAFARMAERRGYCSSSISEELFRLVTQTNHWSKLLTQRELTILPLLARGNTNADLGRTLKSSPATIQVHRKHIMRKLRVSSTPELMQWAREAGVVTA